VVPPQLRVSATWAEELPPPETPQERFYDSLLKWTATNCSIRWYPPECTQKAERWEHNLSFISASGKHDTRLFL